MNKLPVVLSLVAASLGARAETKIDDPEAFVRGVYSKIIAAQAAHHDYDAPDDIYTRRLKALMEEDKRRANGEVGCIEFDWWTNAQDWALKNVVVTSQAVPGKDDRRIVTSTFTNFGKSRQVQFQFQRVNGTWLIDEVESTRGEKWVLSKLLKCW